ncbi:hypothetical protein EGJ53_04865 [Pseudomonas fluorescens]|nr:hypothetical protein EGJ53_04865 [Pseudomonas fluorescens]
MIFLLKSPFLQRKSEAFFKNTPSNRLANERRAIGAASTTKNFLRDYVYLMAFIAANQHGFTLALVIMLWGKKAETMFGQFCLDFYVRFAVAQSRNVSLATLAS